MDSLFSLNLLLWPLLYLILKRVSALYQTKAPWVSFCSIFVKVLDSSLRHSSCWEAKHLQKPCWISTLVAFQHFVWISTSSTTAVNPNNHIFMVGTDLFLVKIGVVYCMGLPSRNQKWRAGQSPMFVDDFPSELNLHLQRISQLAMFDDPTTSPLFPIKIREISMVKMVKHGFSPGFSHGETSVSYLPHQHAGFCPQANTVRTPSTPRFREKIKMHRPKRPRNWQKLVDGAAVSSEDRWIISIMG